MERKIEKQVSRTVKRLAMVLEQDDEPYSVKIGRTPRSMSTLEHMHTIADKTLESLGELGIHTALCYDEDQSVRASMKAFAGLSGYTLGPASKPTIVFLKANPED